MVSNDKAHIGLDIQRWKVTAAANDNSSARRRPARHVSSREEAVAHANEFTAVHENVIAGGCRDELWNAAFEYALAHDLSANAMAAILGVLIRQGRIGVDVARAWALEGRAALDQEWAEQDGEGKRDL